MPETFIEGLGQQAATQATGGILGAGMGLLLEKHNDKRQLKQQQKLTDIQYAANEKAAQANYTRQMQLWHDTNYNAQMQELEKAGLNPGLIYGMGGGGAATTAAAPQQGVSGSSAPTGGGEAMGLMMQQMQLGLMQAQKENINADTANKQADTANKPIQGENIKTQTASLTQGIENSKAATALTKIETQLAQIKATYADESESYRRGILGEQLSLIGNEVEIMERVDDINRETKDAKIQQIKQEALNAVTHGKLMEAQINNIMNSVAQGWQGLNIQDKQQKIQQAIGEEQIKMMPIDRIIRAVDAVTNAIPYKGIMKTGQSTETINPDGTSSYHHTQNLYK